MRAELGGPSRLTGGLAAWLRADAPRRGAAGLPAPRTKLVLRCRPATPMMYSSLQSQHCQHWTTPCTPPNQRMPPSLRSAATPRGPPSPAGEPGVPPCACWVVPCAAGGGAALSTAMRCMAAPTPRCLLPAACAGETPPQAPQFSLRMRASSCSLSLLLLIYVCSAAIIRDVSRQAITCQPRGAARERADAQRSMAQRGPSCQAAHGACGALLLACHSPRRLWELPCTVSPPVETKGTGGRTDERGARQGAPLLCGLRPRVCPPGQLGLQCDGLALGRSLPAQRVIVYPHYISAQKTVAEGRRIPKDKGEGRQIATHNNP